MAIRITDYPLQTQSCGIFQKMQAENGFVLGLPLRMTRLASTFDADGYDSKPKDALIVNRLW